MSVQVLGFKRNTTYSVTFTICRDDGATWELTCEPILNDQDMHYKIAEIEERI